MEIKQVAFFGFYDPDYSRNRVLSAGFRELGIGVWDVRVETKQFSRLGKYWELFKLGWKLKFKKPDLIIVAFPGHLVVPLAYLLFGSKFIFDAFLSIYETEVFDRQTVKAGSLGALKYFFIEWLAVVLSPKVLLDTNAHIDYFVKTFRTKKEKFIRVFVGTTTDIFYPKPNPHPKTFLVHFHGRGTPLHGVDVVEKAAEIVSETNPEIKFRIVGVEKESTGNIEYLPPVPLVKLNEYMAEASIVLGTFGSTPKINLVIPNKIYEGLAVAKPIITTDSPAVRELLLDKETAFLVSAGDSEAIAKMVIELKNNPELFNRVAKRGHQLFLEKTTARNLVRGLIENV